MNNKETEIALVRATNIIPFDGVVRPISNVCYLTKNIGLEFSSRLSDLLKSEKIIPPLDITRMFEEGYYEKAAVENANILRNYLPYVSDYNSTVLFSLNGLCPDDNEHGFANNVFSNKKCAIIEPLKPHLSQLVSIHPTDTAVKGDVVLSNDAIVLIDQETYQNLPEDKKQSLQNSITNIQLFSGSLKENVNQALQNSNRFSQETLTLSSNHNGIVPSATSETLQQQIDNIATVYNLSEQKYFDLLTKPDTTTASYEKMEGEYANMVEVQEYYMSNFLTSLLKELKADDDMIKEVPSQLYNRIYMESITAKIKEYGIDNYKTFVDNYNATLLTKSQNHTLPTPSEIIQQKQEENLSKVHHH